MALLKPLSVAALHNELQCQAKHITTLTFVTQYNNNNTLPQFAGTSLHEWEEATIFILEALGALLTATQKARVGSGINLLNLQCTAIVHPMLMATLLLFVNMFFLLGIWMAV